MQESREKGARGHGRVAPRRLLKQELDKLQMNSCWVSMIAKDSFLLLLHEFEASAGRDLQNSLMQPDEHEFTRAKGVCSGSSTCCSRCPTHIGELANESAALVPC